MSPSKPQVHAATPHDESERLARLRDERDRFVAFAFCDCDMLVEVDSRHRIAFAAGATSAFLGFGPSELVGKLILDVVADNGRSAVERAFELLENGQRIDPFTLQMLGPQGPTPSMTMIGYQLPDLNGHYFLSFRLGGAGQTVETTSFTRDPDSGLICVDDVGRMTETCATAALRVGKECGIAILSFDGLSALLGSLDSHPRSGLMGAIGRLMKRASLYGDAAARVGEDSFILLHNPSTDLAALIEGIERAAREADPKRAGVKGQATAINLSAVAGGAAEVAEALAVAAQAPSDGEAEGNGGLASRVQNTAEQMASVRATITGRNFEMVFQPVVEFDGGRPLFFQALGRFRRKGGAMDPAEFGAFAETLGVAGEFDIAMCERIADWIAHGPGRSNNVDLSLCLSHATVCNRDIRGRLLSLLDGFPDAAKRLVFEIRGSTVDENFDETTQLIYRLRSDGFRVFIDAFDAGPSAIHNLYRLDISGMRVSQDYFREAAGVTRGRLWLRAIAGLCRDLKLTAIADIADDDKLAPVARECGFRYGRGKLLTQATAGPAKIGATEVSWT